MSRALRFLPLAVALCAACGAPPTVDEIVAAHLQARGGKQRIQALQAIRASATVTASGGRVALLVREIKRPGRIRLEFTYQGVTGVYAHDGAEGWEIAPLQGRFEPTQLPPETAEAAVDQLDIEGPLVDWRAKGHQVQLVGREMVDGREVDKLRVELKGGVIRYDYLDATSHLLVRADFARVVRSQKVDLETTFSDHREVGGIVFPHLIVSRAKGRPQSSLRIEIEEIELDPVLEESRFRRPE